MPSLPFELIKTDGSTRRGLTEDFADKAAVIHIFTTDVSADNDNVIRSGDIKAGIKAQGCIGNASGIIGERKSAYGCVAASVGAAEQRLIAKGRVLGTNRVTGKRLETKRVVGKSCRVTLKRVLTHGVVSAAAKAAGAVGMLERSRADGHISAVRAVNPNDGARRKRIRSNSYIAVSGGVAKERVKTNGSVVARIVLKQGLYSDSGIKNTFNVIAQNIDPQSSICTAASIGKERVAADGCVGVSGSIVDERANAIRRVPGTTSVA